MALQQKAFSDIITFSRSSNATRVGPSGLVEYAPHNLLVRSQEFDNASWTKTGASVTANAIAAPDGTVTADKLVEDSSTGAHQAANSFTFISNTTYTFSVFAKAGERSWALLVPDGIPNGGAWFNLATGVVGTKQSGVTSASIQSVGNGWYRCSVTGTSNGAAAVPNVRCATADNTSSYTGDGASGIYLWGAQLSVGSIAGDYTPTTSAAVYGPRFDYDGSGVTSVQPIAKNLLTYSEDFSNAVWNGTNITVAADTVVSPDGTLNADKLIPTSTSGYHYVMHTTGATASTATTYSFYARAGEYTRIAIDRNAFDGNQATVVDLTNGSVLQAGGFYSSISATNVGNGWYRISVLINSASAATLRTRIVPIPNSLALPYTSNTQFSGDGTSGIYVWGAQLEIGATATAYMASGATNGMRAVPVTTGSVVARGLLIEEQRTNLLTYSEDFSNAVWSTAGNVNITANAAVSPDGTTTADTMTEVATTATHRVECITSGTSVATQYTVSCYVKPASGSPWFRLTFTDSTGNHQAQCWFDLTNGVNGSTAVVGSAVLASRSITAVGNGWYRCTLTATVTGGTGVVYLYISLANADGVQSYLGSASRAVYLWGAQLEAGAFATSYIPTIASSVTRSADVATVDTLSPWFNATEGTIFAEWRAIGSNSYSNVVAISDGTANNSSSIYRNNSETLMSFASVSGGTISANITQSTVAFAGSTEKGAGAYKLNDFAASFNGLAASTDTSGAVPTGINLVRLGSAASSNEKFNGYLRRVAYYPRRLTNAELQTLTA